MCYYGSGEMPETIDVLSDRDPGSELGWEAGIPAAGFSVVFQPSPFVAKSFRYHRFAGNRIFHCLQLSATVC